MKTIGICGDSYMSATQDLDRPDCKGGIHFTQLLSKKLGYQYKTFARGGCSNYCISHQVEQMVRENVDLIIVGFTSSTRIDVPVKELNNHVYNIFDFDYVDYPDLSSLDSRFNTSPKIISDSISNVMEHSGEYHGHSINHYKHILGSMLDGTLRNIKDYVSGGFSDLLYSNDIRSISHTLRVLEKSGIPYVWYWSHDDGTFAGEKFKVEGDLCPVTYTSHDCNYRFHTTEESQIRLCELWLEYLESEKNHLLI